MSLSTATQEHLPQQAIYKEESYIYIHTFQGQVLKILNGDGKNVFETTDVGIEMAHLLLQLGKDGHIPHGTFLDNGCGNGILGTIGSTYQPEKILFHDVSPHALEHAKKSINENFISTPTDFLLGEELFTLEPSVDFCCSNLPQNPKLDFCGTGGSELQIEVSCKIAAILEKNAFMLTKSVSYADPIHTNDSLKKAFRIEKLSDSPCKNPNDGSNANVTYFLLEKR